MPSPQRRALGELRWSLSLITLVLEGRSVSFESSFQEMGCGLVQSAKQVDAKATSFCVKSFHKTGDEKKVLALAH